MRKTQRFALAGIIAAIGIGLGLTGTARSQLTARLLEPLPKELAKTTGLAEEDVLGVLRALGPAISKRIATGSEVAIQGFGTFRVVRLAESRNLVDGRPVVEPARNVVEFLPEPGVEQAANAAGVTPAVTVPAFQYNTLPGQVPGQKVPSIRAPSTRIR